jgi:hypothetical protein
MAAKRGSSLGPTRWFLKLAGTAQRAGAGEHGDVTLWRGHLGSREEAVRRGVPRSVGLPELLDREPGLCEVTRSHRSLRSLIAALVRENAFISANSRLLSSAGNAKAALSPGND